ncbi:MAG: DUF3131 domain-containing protein [Pseudomonadota bacterium]
MPQQFSLKSLWFMGGLLAAAGAATWLDGATFRSANPLESRVDVHAPLYALAGQRSLTWRERQAAEVAWTFLETQTQPDTGWVNSVSDFPSSTLWDQGSYVMALVSAVKLGVIDRTEFDHRAALFLASLAKIELIDGNLPNKVYNTRTLQMTNYEDRLTPDGIGWSALDIARLLLALRILERFDPTLGPIIQHTLQDWDLASVASNGELVGSSPRDGGLVLLQEGRIGYEQYGARAAAMWGLDVSQAVSARRVLTWRTISKTDVPVDARSAARYQTINPTSSEPYVLMGLEMGFDAESRALAERVLAAQEQRFNTTDQMTIVSEDHLDMAPFFAYASVFSNGQTWAVVDAQGGHHPDMRTQSTKASFGWDALYDTDFTNWAVNRVSGLANPAKGWYAGIYERTGGRNTALALNTNAVILTALHYREFGPLWNIHGSR